ncbi:Serine/threonine kinase family protein [Rhodotorula toruloides]|nr:Serine/threonine kinase family protein [Rhodotorula toruloides]
MRRDAQDARGKKHIRQDNRQERVVLPTAGPRSLPTLSFASSASTTNDRSPLRAGASKDAESRAVALSHRCAVLTSLAMMEPLISPLLPTPRADVYKLPSLLPFGLTYNVLMSHGDRFRIDDLVTYRPGLPAWTMRLELAYHQFDPAAWDILEEDDEVDLAIGSQLLKDGRLPNKAESPADIEPLERTSTACWSRVVQRWMRLYALHACRKQYFREVKAIHPDWTDQDVRANLPLGANFAPPPAANRSLWPLPIPHPDPSRRPHLVDLCAPNFDWSPYCLWDEPTTESELRKQRMNEVARAQRAKLDAQVRPGTAELAELAKGGATVGTEASSGRCSEREAASRAQKSAPSFVSSSRINERTE